MKGVWKWLLADVLPVVVQAILPALLAGLRTAAERQEARPAAPPRVRKSSDL